MAFQPQIEDVDDPDVMDLEEVQRTMQPVANNPAQRRANPAMDFDPAKMQAFRAAETEDRRKREEHMRIFRETTKEFQVLYPVYFDLSRSRGEGRRVNKEYAIKNPLAKDIANAVPYVSRKLGVQLKAALEHDKTHPKDWANNGRVRIEIKKNGEAVSSAKTKGALMQAIAECLHNMATGHIDRSAENSADPGLDYGEDAGAKNIKPAIPRGTKLGTNLPFDSRALSGGGVNDNFMNDMMNMAQSSFGQMPGQGRGGRK